MILPKNIIRKGFTLVELVISIAIIAIITGVSIPSFLSYINNQTVKQAQDQFKSDLRTVQNKALTGVSSDKFVGSLPAKYWVIRVVAGASTYSTFYTAEATSSACTSATALTTATLPENTSLSWTGAVVNNTGCLFFSIAEGNVSSYNISLPLTSSGAVFIISSSKSSTTANVFVNQYGLVK